MTRIGEDMSERLDIVPAEFFVHRHIYSKWACRCCQVLSQAPSIPELIEGGMAASSLVAHTLTSRGVAEQSLLLDVLNLVECIAIVNAKPGEA